MRSLSIGWTAALSLLAGAGAHAAATVQEPSWEERVEDLARRSDPRADDWHTEILYARASEVLHGLLDGLAADADLDTTAWIAPGAASSVLAPEGGEQRDLGDLRLRRWVQGEPEAPGGDEPARRLGLDGALRAWLAPLRGGRPPRVAFKVVGVHAPDPEGAGEFATTLLVTLSGEASGDEVQQNAAWRVDWQVEPRGAPEGDEDDGGDGGDGEGPLPRVRGVELLDFSEVRAPVPLFEECTGSVLPADPDLRAQLARGGEYWFGRTDALGEWNLFGHNGIALGDVNGDGLDDLYVAMGTGLPNKLLVRQPDGSLVDTAHEAGAAWLDDTKGVLLVDYDNDGDQDLFCAIGPTIVLSENDGSGVFTPARSLRAATDAAFYSLAAADYDLDGDLDLYATRYVKTRYGESLPVPFHDARNGPRNHLLRNDFPDGFADVTDSVGLGVDNDRFSLAVGWEDYDLDGDPDLYVANDFGRNNLYRNDGGTFVSVAAEAGAEDMSAGMGVSWGDVDQDGDPDLLVSNMFSAAGQRVAYQPRFEAERDDSAAMIQRHALGNTLLVNDGAGSFEDRSAEAGIRMGRWAWGGSLIDLTSDGFPDMVVPNGFLTGELEDDL